MASSDQRHPCRWWQLFPAIFQGQLLSSQQSLLLPQRHQGSPKSRSKIDRFTLGRGVGVAAGAGDGDWGDGWTVMGGTVDLARRIFPDSSELLPRASFIISPIPSGRMEFLESGKGTKAASSAGLARRFPQAPQVSTSRHVSRACPALPRRTRPTKRNSRTLASPAPA